MEQQSRPEGPGPFARQRLVMGEEAMDRLARARGELRKILRKDGNFFDSGASNPVNKKGGAP